MAKFSVGSLTLFNHEQQDWTLYKDRLEQWFLANDIGTGDDKTGSKRRAILLSSLAEPTYKLIRDLALPKSVGTLSYNNVVELLDGHFETKKCGFAERCKFYGATQARGESLADWAARVRGLALHCDFGASTLEEALRDRFVLGMQSGPERDLLFTKAMEGLTLSKALELADGVRAARAGSQQEAMGQAELATAQVLKVAAAARPQTARPPAAASPAARADPAGCPACGYDGHDVSRCKFTRYRCKKCGVKGHLRRMCPGKGSSRHHFIECGADGDGYDVDGKRIICNIRTQHGEPMKETILVNNVRLNFEIDTGSAVTVISEEIFNKYFSTLKLNPSKLVLQSYNNSIIHTLGYVSLSFSYNNQSRNLDVYVVRDGGPPLLGRDFLLKFKLQISPLNLCSDVLDQFAQRYPNLFSDKLGCFNGGTVNLDLKPDSKPIFRKARPLPFAIREKVEQEIDRLVELGILVPVQYSDYASPIVPVIREDKKLRLCVDYSTTINKQLFIDKYPLPRVDELFAKLHGGQQFSKLDLSRAYNQFCLSDSSQDLTCINTHKGLYKFTRLVFGLSSAPAVFQRAMEALLSGLDGVLLFLDDICVTGKDKKEHSERLNQVFDRLEKAGLVLQKQKCLLFQDSISYLGFVIDRNGIHKSPEKVKAILNAKTPTNVSELKSFLGMINYYRSFIKNASSIMSPLHKLLQKGSMWQWCPEHELAITNIKTILASDNTLAHFNPNAKIILTVDASPYGLGAILSQEENGVEKPVSFMSRSLSPAEKRYSQIQKEAAAIVFGVKKFHQYLFGRSDPFILRTDHKPLLSIFNPSKGIPEISANRLQRYAIFLSAYNYKIEYVSSANNAADFLSRSVAESSCAPRAAASSCDSVDELSYVNFIYNGHTLLSQKEVKEATHNDIVLKSVVKYCLTGWPRKITDKDIKPYFMCRNELSLEEDCLIRGSKLIIPECLRKNVLVELHSGHLGISKVKSEARDRFWWPGMSSDIERYVSSCDVCATLRPAPPRVPLAPWPHPPAPWHRVHLDFLGPINNKTYLVIVDAYSKWVECYDVSTGYGSRIVIEKLCDVMARFGLFHTILTDNGTSFCSTEFKSFCDSNGIKHITSPPYNPQSNGQAESYVKIIKKAIKSIILSGSNLRDLNIKLCEFLLKYRNSKHFTTERSPSEVLFGHRLRSRLDVLCPSGAQAQAAPAPAPADTTLGETVTRNQSLQCKHYTGNRKVSFVSGEVVLVKVFKNQKCEWAKAVILEKLGSNVYSIQLLNSQTVLKKHANQILKFKGEEDVSVIPNESENVCESELVLPPVMLSSVSAPVSPEPEVQATQTDDVSAPSATTSVSDSEPQVLEKRKRKVINYKSYF